MSNSKSLLEAARERARLARAQNEGQIGRGFNSATSAVYDVLRKEEIESAMELGANAMGEGLNKSDSLELGNDSYQPIDNLESGDADNERMNKESIQIDDLASNIELKSTKKGNHSEILYPNSDNRLLGVSSIEASNELSVSIKATSEAKEINSSELDLNVKSVIEATALPGQESNITNGTYTHSNNSRLRLSQRLYIISIIIFGI